MCFSKLKSAGNTVVIKVGKVSRRIRNAVDIEYVHIRDRENCRTVYIKRSSTGKIDLIYDDPDWLGYGFYTNDYYIDPADLGVWGSTDSDLKRYLNYARSGWYANRDGSVQYKRIPGDQQVFMNLNNGTVFCVDRKSENKDPYRILHATQGSKTLTVE